MNNLWKGIMWIAASIVAIAGMIITGEVGCIAVLCFPFIISFSDMG